MLKNVNVEAEHNELILQNDSGDVVIIPAHRRKWVQRKLEQKCYSCVDEYVKTLPTDTEYAKGGGFFDNIVKAGSKLIDKAVDVGTKLVDDVTTTINPNNWGVNDYSNKGDFGKAYVAARQAGEKEFMFNNKRYNTNYKGTPEQQLKETGLTNSQIQDRSNLNKNLTKNIYPYSYDGLEKRILKAGVLNQKEENREAIDKNPKPYDKEKLDALNLYSGIPQKNNTFKISNYKPSKGNEDVNYYTFNNQSDAFVQNLINYAYLKSEGNLDDSAQGFDIGVKGLVPDQEKNVMGNYKMSTGEDDRGKYVSFYDKWDLSPVDFGKPFEIYDRIYVKDYGSGVEKRMYYTDKELFNLNLNNKNFDILALQKELINRGYSLPASTKSDGTLDGILGEETKAALLDWQKKNKK